MKIWWHHTSVLYWLNTVSHAAMLHLHTIAQASYCHQSSKLVVWKRHKSLITWTLWQLKCISNPTGLKLCALPKDTWWCKCITTIWHVSTMWSHCRHCQIEVVSGYDTMLAWRSMYVSKSHNEWIPMKEPIVICMVSRAMKCLSWWDWNTKRLSTMLSTCTSQFYAPRARHGDSFNLAA